MVHIPAAPPALAPLAALGIVILIVCNLRVTCKHEITDKRIKYHHIHTANNSNLDREI